MTTNKVQECQFWGLATSSLEYEFISQPSNHSYQLGQEVVKVTKFMWEFLWQKLLTEKLNLPYTFGSGSGSGRRGGLMVSTLDSGASGPGSSPGRGHRVVFLGKTIYSHSASLHPGVQMGTSELNARG